MRVSSWRPGRYEQLLVRLRAARLQADLTQVEVAEALKVPQQHVSRIELGERRIDPVELFELAELYGKPLCFFFD